MSNMISLKNLQFFCILLLLGTALCSDGFLSSNTVEATTCDLSTTTSSKSIFGYRGTNFSSVQLREMSPTQTFFFGTSSAGVTMGIATVSSGEITKVSVLKEANEKVYVSNGLDGKVGVGYAIGNTMTFGILDSSLQWNPTVSVGSSGYEAMQCASLVLTDPYLVGICNGGLVLVENSATAQTSATTYGLTWNTATQYMEFYDATMSESSATTATIRLSGISFKLKDSVIREYLTSWVFDITITKGASGPSVAASKFYSAAASVGKFEHIQEINGGFALAGSLPQEVEGKSNFFATVETDGSAQVNNTVESFSLYEVPSSGDGVLLSDGNTIATWVTGTTPSSAVSINSNSFYNFAVSNITPVGSNLFAFGGYYDGKTKKGDGSISLSTTGELANSNAGNAFYTSTGATISVSHSTVTLDIITAPITIKKGTCTDCKKATPQWNANNNLAGFVNNGPLATLSDSKPSGLVVSAGTVVIPVSGYFTTSIAGASLTYSNDSDYVIKYKDGSITGTVEDLNTIFNFPLIATIQCGGSTFLATERVLYIEVQQSSQMGIDLWELDGSTPGEVYVNQDDLGNFQLTQVEEGRVNSASFYPNSGSVGSAGIQSGLNAGQNVFYLPHDPTAVIVSGKSVTMAGIISPNRGFSWQLNIGCQFVTFDLLGYNFYCINPGQVTKFVTATGDYVSAATFSFKGGKAITVLTAITNGAGDVVTVWASSGSIYVAAFTQSLGKTLTYAMEIAGASSANIKTTRLVESTDSSYMMLSFLKSETEMAFYKIDSASGNLLSSYVITSTIGNLNGGFWNPTTIRGYAFTNQAVIASPQDFAGNAIVNTITVQQHSFTLVAGVGLKSEDIMLFASMPIASTIGQDFLKLVLSESGSISQNSGSAISFANGSGATCGNLSNSAMTSAISSFALGTGKNPSSGPQAITSDGVFVDFSSSGSLLNAVVPTSSTQDLVYNSKVQDLFQPSLSPSIFGLSSFDNCDMSLKNAPSWLSVFSDGLDGGFLAPNYPKVVDFEIEITCHNLWTASKPAILNIAGGSDNTGGHGGPGGNPDGEPGSASQFMLGALAVLFSIFMI